MWRIKDGSLVRHEDAAELMGPSVGAQVKYPILWRIGYTVTQPRIVHVPAQQVMGLLVGRQVSAAYAKYRPDLVVSVHPLMQASRTTPHPPCPQSCKPRAPCICLSSAMQKVYRG